MNNLELLESVLTYIDEHLNDNITFELLADKFGYSAFHFHKLFSTVTGQTITDYLKKRRLQYIYKDLLDTDKTVTELCYQYGFHSVSTFNRVFKSTYGMIPTQARKRKEAFENKSIQSIISGYKKRVHFQGEYELLPRFLHKGEFTIIGVRKYTGNGFQVIGEAWGELKADMNKINRVNAPTMYGFEDYSKDFDSETMAFYYMAAVEAKKDAPIPEGMCKVNIPESLYAVFTVNGNNQNCEIARAFQYIYKVWMPNSEYCLKDELPADFEYYDERWDCRTGSAQMDLYIPVRKIDEQICGREEQKC